MALSTKGRCPINGRNLANLALSDSGFLFDVTTGHTYTLNKTATFILKNLIEGNAPEEVARATTQRYVVSPEIAMRDIERFIARLVSLGLMKKGGQV